VRVGVCHAGLVQYRCSPSITLRTAPISSHASGEPLQQWATTLSQGPFGPVTVECVNDRVPGFGPPDAAHGPERSAIAGTNTLCDTCRALRWVSN